MYLMSYQHFLKYTSSPQQCLVLCELSRAHISLSHFSPAVFIKMTLHDLLDVYTCTLQ